MYMFEMHFRTLFRKIKGDKIEREKDKKKHSLTRRDPVEKSHHMYVHFQTWLL